MLRYNTAHICMVNSEVAAFSDMHQAVMLHLVCDGPRVFRLIGADQHQTTDVMQKP
ncbi:hypothetical protein D3C80_2002350 [compost metagenome]